MKVLRLSRFPGSISEHYRKPQPLQHHSAEILTASIRGQWAQRGPTAASTALPPSPNPGASVGQEGTVGCSLQRHWCCDCWEKQGVGYGLREGCGGHHREGRCPRLQLCSSTMQSRTRADVQSHPHNSSMQPSTSIPNPAAELLRALSASYPHQLSAFLCQAE